MPGHFLSLFVIRFCFVITLYIEQCDNSQFLIAYTILNAYWPNWIVVEMVRGPTDYGRTGLWPNCLSSGFAPI